MTDTETTPDDLSPRQTALSTERRKPWKVRFAGRLFLLLSVPLTCFYVQDVPRAFSYMEMGELPPRINVLWLEYSVRDFYLPGKSASKLIRAALPASAVGFSGLLFLLGCAAMFAGRRLKVSPLESFIWSSLGAFLLGINAMATWIVWKAFVFA
ncbi:hypothetical protein HQ563_03760 [bacterium]|nr:hypothetical protein [bacterium]